MEYWNSRRSPIYSVNGICASSQPLATSTGVQILQQGGTAADAAVAMAAALNVLEPCSTGIGGDAFALYYEASSRAVTCLLGNGTSSSNINLDLLNSRGIGPSTSLNPYSGLCVTVPGAAALWDDLILAHGRLNLNQVLNPAILMAEMGVPISPVTAHQWSHGVLQGTEANRVFRPNGKTPVPGELFRNPDLGRTFRELGEKGATDGFYNGRIAEEIVKATKEFGGVLDLDDLASHRTDFQNPISLVYKGIRIYETPPPTQGLTALMALGMVERVEKRLNHEVNPELPLSEQSNRNARSSVTQAHISIECMRLAFSDALQFIADPKCITVPTDVLLSDKYLQSRSKDVRTDQAMIVESSSLAPYLKDGDTVYFCCVDKDGNACSMINSNYMGFGTGISPNGTGFTLQNRGYNFSLIPGHSNALGPRKKPYHTIIPALATYESDGSLFGVYGNMGGFMQPMGHMQLTRNLIDFRLNPQEALDAPRWYVVGPGKVPSLVDGVQSEVWIEDGYAGPFDRDTSQPTENIVSTDAFIDDLKARGHNVSSLVVGNDRGVYGRGQIILRDPTSHVLCAGSDPRADGCAMPVL